MAELLLELLSEEIPARMQARAAEDLKRLVCDGLNDKKLGQYLSEARSFVTPRRLALVIVHLPIRQMDSTEVRKGPRPDAPEEAIAGFKRSLPKGAKIKKRETTKGTFLFASIYSSGQATAEVLPGILEAALADLPWPKSMRWADRQERWVRPLQGILCIFDGKIVLMSFAGIDSGNKTAGHRFLAPKKIAVKGFADYKKKLKTAKVMLDQGERRAEILKQAKQAAARAKLKLKDDPALLDEVTGLVEWPVVLMGRIDDQFMDLPPEVLTTAMRHHLKYLPLLDKAGNPASRFLVVANMTTTDKGKAIVAGNERVLRARLADARFFWDQDRKTPLSARAPRLADIVFHAKLGSLDDKIDRVQALATRLADHVPGADKDRVRSAARLAKADLVTGMVGEFPELQGVMGRYYALADGEHPEVAQAIAEHYAPQGPNDACPTAPVSVALALADKIDTLFWFFAIDEKPTGSKDPYALRRAALGVIRLIVENNLRLPLMEVFELAFFGGPIRVEGGWGRVAGELLDFFADRLKVALRGKGVRHDLISAVFALGGEDDLVRLLDRVEALEDLLKTDDGGHLLVAYQRAANIVRIEEKRDDKRYDGAPVTDWFQQDEEHALHVTLSATAKASSVMLDAQNFSGAMSKFAELRGPVDSFFDHVTVNCDDEKLRANRLRLLSEIRSTFDQVADFSKIEG